MPVELSPTNKGMIFSFLTTAMIQRKRNKRDYAIACYVGKLQARVNVLEAENEMLREKLKGIA